MSVGCLLLAQVLDQGLLRALMLEPGLDLLLLDLLVHSLAVAALSMLLVEP